MSTQRERAAADADAGPADPAVPRPRRRPATWKRLEGSAIDPQMTDGLAARIADPLWLLARQWQVGELRGEDAASPTRIDAVIRYAPITTYADNAGATRALDPDARAAPLEAWVEREPIAEGPAAHAIALESGAALLRALVAAGIDPSCADRLARAYRLTDALDSGLDPVGAARLRLLSRRCPDARRIVAAIDDAGRDAATLPELAPLAEADRRVAARVIDAWRVAEGALLRDVAATAPSAWSPRRLEYSFGVGAQVDDDEIVLRADEYPGGRLDWLHFDVVRRPRSRPPGGAGAGLASPLGIDRPTARGPEGRGPDNRGPEVQGPEDRSHGWRSRTLTSLPAPLQIAGMPAARWWELEDGAVDFGGLAEGPEDLARSIVAAYSTVAGDDWLLVPCVLPAGTLSQVTHLRVLDDFGDASTIPATAVADAAWGQRSWRWLELSGDPGPERGEAPLLLLPPGLHSVERSSPLEQVELRRDEMANLAWAIERRVESEAGRPIDRDGAAPPTPDDATIGTTWRYALTSELPEHWIPLVPMRVAAADPQVVLQRGRIAASEPSGASRARGRILVPEQPFFVNEEEIPAGGVQVTRTYQLARGSDGSAHLWVGRHKTPGAGPLRRSPLRFDRLSSRDAHDEPD